MFWLRESFARTYSGDDQAGVAPLNPSPNLNPQP